MSEEPKDAVDEFGVDEFERELEAGVAAAEALKERASGKVTGPLVTGDGAAAPLVGPIGVFLTAPSPESMQRAETYWRDLAARQEQRKQEAETKRREGRDRVATAKLPPGFSWASFEAKEFDERIKNRRAILQAKSTLDELRVVLHGSAGVGKTSLAAAMIRARFVLHGGTFAFEPAWHLAVARSRHPLGQGEPSVIERAIEADILVIDDLGNEKPNPTSAVDDVIFERHWAAKATWITTSKSVAEVKDRYGDGIARRVYEKAIVIDCEGKTK